jgi:ubiquitin C-terminal hydrolase
VDKPAECYDYSLKGIIIHSGNADRGHYYSYINTKDSDQPIQQPKQPNKNSKWLEFNDRDVKNWNISDLESECYGGKTVDNQYQNNQFNNFNN